jgi:hypothetical protein
MALDSLITDAFQRGCGISRSSALKSARYQELVASTPRVPNTTQSETAEMMYLGERLADRAFQHLPYAIRKRAEAWQAATEVEQHATLNLLMTRLTNTEWLRIHGRQRRSSHEISEVLPAERGSWARGRVQPNCLGMTQMLIGFARATGAKHLMVDIVTQFDLFNEQQAEQACRSMLELLAPHRDNPSIARISAKIEKYRLANLSALAHMEEIQQAHHALLIKVGSFWVLVDPYLGRKYQIDVLSKGNLDIYRAVTKHPRRRWMQYGGKAIQFDSAYSIAALKEVLELYKRRNEPTSSFDIVEATARASSALCWIGEERSKKKPARHKISRTYQVALTAALLTRTEAKRLEKGSKVPASIERSTNHRFDQAQRRKRDRNAALLRLIRYTCLVSLEIPYQASISRKTEHRRIEIAHPTLHLAVMTLNHMGHMSNRSTAELLRFDSGQWLIHDTLREVMESEDNRLMRIAAANLRRVAKYAHHTMPVLLTEHNKRKS